MGAAESGQAGMPRETAHTLRELADLVMAHQVVDVVAVHELRGGGQILSRGTEAMCGEFAEWDRAAQG